MQFYQIPVRKRNACVFSFIHQWRFFPVYNIMGKKLSYSNPLLRLVRLALNLCGLSRIGWV
jgi:hypothetical protein